MCCGSDDGRNSRIFSGSEEGGAVFPGDVDISCRGGVWEIRDATWGIYTSWTLHQF